MTSQVQLSVGTRERERGTEKEQIGKLGRYGVGSNCLLLLCYPIISAPFFASIRPEPRLPCTRPYLILVSVSSPLFPSNSNLLPVFFSPFPPPNPNPPPLRPSSAAFRIHSHTHTRAYRQYCTIKFQLVPSHPQSDRRTHRSSPELQSRLRSPISFHPPTGERKKPTSKSTTYSVPSDLTLASEAKKRTKELQFCPVLALIGTATLRSNTLRTRLHPHLRLYPRALLQQTQPSTQTTRRARSHLARRPNCPVRYSYPSCPVRCLA